MNKIITLGDIFKNLETDEKAFKFLAYIKDMQKEIEELHSIIKEVREYIENENIDVCTIRYNDIQDVKQELLEILDKVVEK